MKILSVTKGLLEDYAILVTIMVSFGKRYTENRVIWIALSALIQV